MALLGLNYPIIYQAKNLQSGLTNITVKIIRPDNSVLGTFQMSEMTAQGMNGVYKYDLNTLSSDLKGEWLGNVDSPTEAYKVALRINFDSPNIAGGIVDTSVKVPILFVKNTKIQLNVKKYSISKFVKSSKMLKNVKTNEKINKLIKKNKITGVVQCKNF